MSEVLGTGWPFTVDAFCAMYAVDFKYKAPVNKWRMQPVWLVSLVSFLETTLLGILERTSPWPS